MEVDFGLTESIYPSNATPPDLKIASNGTGLASGFLFLGLGDTGSALGEAQESALIMSSDGDLIWAGPDMSVSNFGVQTLQDKQVVSYWRGVGGAESSDEASHGYGSVEILDEHYKTIFTVCPKVNLTLRPGTTADCAADAHESFITPRNTMYVPFKRKYYCSLLATCAYASRSQACDNVQHHNR
ncbi:hypothetical protein MRB53_041038 [Persea americana]|nr:hypothetical protein MRB53_041038 [Persea americana]